MSIFDRLREGVDKATFETNKLVRINKVQSRVNDLNRQVERQMMQIGERVFDLYRAGQISDEALTGFCQQIEQLRQQIDKQNAELDQIRQERPPEQLPLDPNRPRATYGHICPTCRVALDESLRFCTQCGTQAVDVPPPVPEAVETSEDSALPNGGD